MSDQITSSDKCYRLPAPDAQALSASIASFLEAQRRIGVVRSATSTISAANPSHFELIARPSGDLEMIIIGGTLDPRNRADVHSKC